MKQFWYHCSNEFHGDRWALKPRTPSPLHMPISEPLTPRLCVCPVVVNCFAALMFDDAPVHVYRTATPRNGVKPVNVWDSVITRERWIVDRVEMIRIETIDASKVAAINSPFKVWHAATKNEDKVDVRLRIAQIAVAVKVLGPERSSHGELRWLARVSKHFGIDDAEEYMLDRILQAFAKKKADFDGSFFGE